MAAAGSPMPAGPLGDLPRSPSCYSSAPFQSEGVVRADADACTKTAAFPIQSVSHPGTIGRGRRIEPHVAHLQRHHLEAGECRIGGPDRLKVHQHQVITVFLVAADTLVVVEEIAAAVED